MDRPAERDRGIRGEREHAEGFREPGPGGKGSPGQRHRRRVADLVGIRNRFHGRWLGADPAATEPGTGLLQWLSSPDATEGLILKVRDKGRLEAGQDVTWVIQTDGLTLYPMEVTKPPSPELNHALVVRVSEIKHLGESSIVTLQSDALPEVKIRMTLTGPQRSLIEKNREMRLMLDTSWVHIMPLLS